VRRTGNSLTRAAAENAFCRLRAHANVLRHDGARYQPRLHDLRHAAATHRLQLLLLFLYNSGARASEAGMVRIQDLNLASSSVRIVGKGGQQRSRGARRFGGPGPTTGT
jgi:hypothetical protein